MGVFDLQTALYPLILTWGVCGFFLGWFWLQQRQRFRGSGWWLAAYGLQAVGLGLVVARLVGLPLLVSILLGPPLLVISQALMLHGLELYLHDNRRNRFQRGLVAVFIAGHVGFSLLDPHGVWRSAWITLSLVLIFSRTLWVLWVDVEASFRPAARVLGGIYLFLLAAAALRLAADLLTATGQGSAAPLDGLSAPALVAYQQLLIAQTLALVLLMNRRLRQESEAEAAGRARSEAALQVSRAEMQAILDAIPDTLLEVDRQGQVLYWRSNAAVFPDPVIGQDLSMVLPAAAVQAILAAVAAADRPDGSPSGVCAVEGPAGLRWFELRAQARPVAAAGGRYVVLMRDISERKAAEAQLEHSQERFRLLLDSTAEGIFGVDLQGCITFCNRAALQQLGYAQLDDLIGRHAHPLLHHSRRDGTPVANADCEIYRAFREGIPTHVVEEVFWTRQQTCFPVEAWSYPLKVAGQVVGAVVTFIDIQQRLQAEKTLRDSEEKFRGLAELSPQIVFEVDLTGRLTYLNPPGRQILGLSGRDPLQELSLPQLCIPEDQRRLAQALQEEFEDGYSDSTEYTFVRPDGSRLTALVYLRPVRVDGGRTGTHGLVVDITERKRAEDLLHLRVELFEYAETHALPGVLQKAIDFAEAMTGSCIGFYHFAELDRPMLSLQMWSTRTLGGYCHASSTLQHYPLEQAGVWADCVTTRAPVIHDDYAALPHRKGLPSGHAALIREVVVPVLRNDQVVAILGVGNKLSAYTAQDVEMVRYFGDVAWNIVERQTMQAALRASEEKYRCLFRDSPDAYLLLENGRVVDCNPAAQAMLQCERSAVLGRSPADLSPAVQPGGRPSAMAFASWLMVAGERGAAAFEWAFQRADQSELPVEVSMAALALQQQAMVFMTMRDITTRRQAEQLVRESETRLRALLDASRDGFVFFDAQSVLRVVNPPALALLALPGLVTDWEGVSNERFIQVLGQANPDAARTGKFESLRPQPEMAPLSEGEMEIAGRVLQWYNLPVVAAGEVAGRLLVLHDITVVRQTDRLRDDLTDTLIHDLRSPLGILRGALQVFELDGLEALTGDQKDALQLMYPVLDGLGELISSILDVNRLETGQFPLDRVPVPLAWLAAEWQHLHEPLLRQRRLQFAALIPSDLPLLAVDPGLIRRVLHNLLGNAIKFTPPGGRIWLEAAARHKEVVISVGNTGSAVGPELQARLFQKYVTGRGSERGTGLGLAFCRLAVEAHGGRIWLEPASDLTVVFSFGLPQWDDTTLPADSRA